MEELELQIKRIHEKLQQVLRQRETILKENSKLKEELRQLRQSEGSRTEQVDQLRQQVEILKVKKGEMPLAEKAVLDRRLSQYIREIDRCIALLGE
jgi:ribosomal protein S4